MKQYVQVFWYFIDKEFYLCQENVTMYGKYRRMHLKNIFGALEKTCFSTSKTLFSFLAVRGISNLEVTLRYSDWHSFPSRICRHSFDTYRRTIDMLSAVQLRQKGKYFLSLHVTIHEI
jgi:hypothetical protein